MTSSGESVPTGLFLAAMSLVLFVDGEQIGIKAIETLLPIASVAFHPCGDVLERGGFQSAWAPLCLAAARDEAGMFQYLQVPGYCGKGDIERFGEFLDGRLTGGKPRQNRTAGRVGKGRKGGTQMIGSHGVASKSYLTK